MSRNLSNIDKIFSRSESPNPDRLVDYVNQDMSEEEARKMEEAMVNDPFLSDAVEGIERIGAEDFTDLLAELKADIEGQIDQPEGKEIQFTPAPAATESAPKRKSGFRFTAIAAAVVLLFVAGYFFLPFGGANSLALEHYEKYEIGNALRIEGVQQNEFDKAGSLYKAGKFKEAAQIFEKISDPTAKLMAGHSYFNLRDYDQAAQYFSEVINSNQVINLAEGAREDAEYNLALCLVAQEKNKEASQLLKNIADNGDHPFHIQAANVLKDMGN